MPWRARFPWIAWERFGRLAGALFGGVLGGVGVGLGARAGAAVAVAAGPAALVVAIPLVCVGGSYAFARGISSHIVRRRETRARAVIAEIAAYVERVRAVTESGRLTGDPGTGRD